MKRMLLFILLSLVFQPVYPAKQKNPVNVIANEPVNMMDLGILKLNTSLARPQYPGLQGATISAKYNIERSTIDIKVSMPVTKASKPACRKLIEDTRKIFVKTFDKKKISNIHYFFQHEGPGFRQDINWKDLPNHVYITGVVLTGKNYQDSVYCQSNLMQDKITF